MYIVEENDWLSKIAQMFYNDIPAYPRIVEATNLKVQTDPSFEAISDPDVIEVGQKFLKFQPL